MQFNWKPVVGSLLKTLQDHNFTLEGVDNGDGLVTVTGTPRQRRQAAKAEICATDESRLFVRHPSLNCRMTLLIVLGNEPEETVADYTDWSILDLAINQFSAKWAGRPCPTF